jgi:hypothetical protein
MARLARRELFDPSEIAVLHCINRCVRRCFLCGTDPLTGKNYEHRKAWLEERLEFLASQFGIDVLGFAVLSNHFHLVLRNRPDVVATWNDTEVATRWLRLCPPRREANGEPAEPTAAELNTIRNVPERLAEVRQRLSDISWFMRMIAEPIARRANREEDLNGRFWQGRFKAVKLCDEAAVLACTAYVDLNPIRAGLAGSTASSDFTSVQRRIESLARTDDRAARGDAWLAPVALEESKSPPGPMPSATGRRASDKGFLPLSVEEYVSLVEWTGRQMARGRGRTIPNELPQLLARVGIAEADWLPLVSGFGRLFQRVAGAPHTLARMRVARPFRPGHATLLGRARPITRI